MYKTCIIGAGSIGALKSDSKDRKDRRARPLTHAHACWSHPKIKLDCIVDIKKERAEAAANKWDCSWSTTIPNGADIYIVSVPTEYHLETVEEIVQLNDPIKLIILEKSAGNTEEQASIIKELSLAYDIPILVDYSRRFEVAHQGVYDRLQDPEVEIYNCRVIYSRGLKHEGCHAIDLCNWWFGKGKWLYFNERWADRDAEDQTADIFLKYEEIPVFFNGVNGRKAYTFEIDVFTSIGRFQFIHYGTQLLYYPIVNEGKYGDYPQLGTPQKRYPQMGWNLHYLIDNAIRFIEGKEELGCTIDDALNVHKILEE